MKDEDNVNLELLAEVLHVHSVSHATQTKGGDVHITFRETEEDNSSWFDVSVYNLAHYYKVWAKEKKYNILSDAFGAYVTKLPKKSVNDCDFSSLNDSEPKAVRLVTEKIYENENEKTSF